jgi:hypothetical protein
MSLNVPSRVSARETRWWTDEDENLQAGSATRPEAASPAKSCGVPRKGNVRRRCPWRGNGRLGRALCGGILARLVDGALLDLGWSWYRRRGRSQGGNGWRDDVGCRVSVWSDAWLTRLGKQMAHTVHSTVDSSRQSRVGEEWRTAWDSPWRAEEGGRFENLTRCKGRRKATGGGKRREENERRGEVRGEVEKGRKL